MIETTRRRLLAGAAMGAGAALAGCDIGQKKAKVAIPEPDVLGTLDATGVAEKIKAGEFTAQQAVDAAIARAAKLQPQLNFMITASDAQAIAESAAPKDGPFKGVPTLIKDLLDVKGAPTKYGCRAFANAPPAAAQSPYADAMQNAGLISIGKSTTPEFGFTATTEPLLGGATRNPWNPDYSSGGSSGGAAVAVAAGVVPIAHASDGGGSIRIPACINGLVGLKVSRGRNIDSGRPDGPVSLSVQGCVSRTVRDTAAFFHATQASGEGAALTPIPLITGPSTNRLNIAVMTKDLLGRDPDPEIAAAVEATAADLEKMGHKVRRDYKMAINGQAFSEAFSLYWASFAKQMKDQIMANAPAGVTPDQVLEPLSLGLAELVEKSRRSALPQAIATLKLVDRQYAVAMKDVDVLLTPVLAKQTVKIGEISPALGMDAFAKVSEIVAYTPLQNAAGAPAISLPLAMSSTGMPIGLHFAAKVGQEATLLQLAFELEQAKPWIDRKPKVHA
jgi:amidase